MRVVVLIKQVPNTTKVKLDPVTNNLIRDGVESILNPYDIYALEMALRMKEERKDCTVEVLSMGPDAAADVIKYAYSLGADKGTLLSDRAFAGSDTLATSYILSRGILKDGMPELILCGKQAIDGDTAQVPEELAGHLGINCITNVSRVKEMTDTAITVERKTDYASMTMQSEYPVVLTVEKGFADPRLPLLADLVASKDVPVTVIRSGELDADPGRMSVQGSPTAVVRVFSPENSKESVMLSGTLEEQVAQCMEILKHKGGSPWQES